MDWLDRIKDLINLNFKVTMAGRDIKVNLFDRTVHYHFNTDNTEINITPQTSSFDTSQKAFKKMLIENIKNHADEIPQMNKEQLIDLVAESSASSALKMLGVDALLEKGKTPGAN